CPSSSLRERRRGCRGAQWRGLGPGSSSPRSARRSLGRRSTWVFFLSFVGARSVAREEPTPLRADPRETRLPPVTLVGRSSDAREGARRTLAKAPVGRSRRCPSDAREGARRTLAK